MSTMSYFFICLMLLPLLAFLFWVIKQDKRRSPLGLILLAIGVIAASFVIIRYDSNFKIPSNLQQPDSSPLR